MASLTDVTVDVRSYEYRLPDGMVFITGNNKVILNSRLNTNPNPTFAAQTGLPDRDYTYVLGEKQVIHINGHTGMIE